MAALGSIGVILDMTPLQVVGGTISGAITDAYGNPAVRDIVVIHRATKTLDGSTRSKTDGTYAVTVPPLKPGERSVICLDDDAGSLENDLVLRTFPV